MTFDEVVNYFQSNKKTDEEFIAIFFRPEDKYFGFYEVSVDTDDPEWISFSYEGGYLFSDGGEMEAYSLDDLPDEAKTLTYIKSKDLPNIGGYTSEFALHLLFPSLPDPSNIWDKSDQDNFVKAVTQQLANEVTPCAHV